MYFSVELALRADRRLTIDSLMGVAAVSGFACGNPGGWRVETTLTIWAKDAPTAASRAIERARRRVRGQVIAVHVMTIREADRRLRALLRS